MMRTNEGVGDTMRRSGLAILALLLVAGACTTSGNGGSGGVGAASVGLERFDSCDALLGHIRTQALETIGPFGFVTGHRDLAIPELAEGRAEAGVSQDAAAAPAGVDFSGTNVQEAGVDEPDLVKTDGSRILALGGNRLHHITLTDDTPRLGGSVDLPAGWGHNLLLAGDRALVFLTPEPEGQPAHDPDLMRIMPAYSERTVVAVVDVRDPASMRVVTTLDFEGSYVSARFTGGVARIVVRSGGPRLAFAYPEDGSPAALRRVERHNRELIRSSTLEDWIPGYTLEDEQGEIHEGHLADCERTYHPGEFAGTGLTSVVTLDPADPTPRDAASVLADAQIVYASADTLYVATTRWQPGPPMLREPAVVDAPDDSVFSDVDPDASVSSDVEPEVRSAPEPPPVVTEVHAFDITDPRRAVYVASGSVDGTVLNQWALSEHDGHIRVATTVDAWDAARSESFVTVLRHHDGELVTVGRVGDLGRGETIHAVRFMGDVGYVVTFRQIDPLYVLDLRDPARPEVLGELKMPGYSAYLHPVGDGLLLGVGQDATDEGEVLGTQISLFDVTDPHDPQRLHNLRIDRANSEVEHDHLAFLWWAPASMAVFPLHIWNWETGEQPFGGATAVHVGREGIRETGRLSHPATESPNEFRPGTEDLVVGSPQVRRSLVVDTTLYTYSEAGILASDLTTLAELAWIALP